MHRVLLSAALLLILALPATAELITSTPTGGLWTEPGTWEGGNVPHADDDVLLLGPVQVSTAATCENLSIFADGTLSAANPGATLMRANGDVFNEGLVEDGSWWLTVEAGGDILNAGLWLPKETVFVGVVDRYLTVGETAQFDSDITMGDGASGDLLSNGPLRVNGIVDLTGSRLLLQGHAPFTMTSGIFSGELIAAGNSMNFEDSSFLQQATLDGVVLVGMTTIGWGVEFTGGLTVVDGMQNGSGGSHTYIGGGLVNHGLLRNSGGYGFTIELGGDLENNGTIQNSYISLDGIGEQHMRAGPEGLFDAPVFMPEFNEEGTIIADTPLRFSNGIGLGIGSMQLEPGSDLIFTGHGGIGGSFGGGVLYASGNSIELDEYGAIGGCTIDQVVLRGHAVIGGDTFFTGGLTVMDILSNREWNNVVAYVEDGLLLNEGAIFDSGTPFHMVVRGDAENRGSWANARVEVAGESDQVIGAGAGIDVPEFVLVANITAASYQWMRDGEALPGETGSELVLNGVHAADYGLYRCEGNGGVVSRDIVLAEFIDPTDTTPLAGGFSLDQNHPNPFNPATEFRFSLAESGPVKLSVFDVSGRQVDLLVNGNLPAGDHRIEWRPEGLSSGIYLYRLQYAGEELIKKATLVK